MLHSRVAAGIRQPMDSYAEHTSLLVWEDVRRRAENLPHQRPAFLLATRVSRSEKTHQRRLCPIRHHLDCVHQMLGLGVQFHDGFTWHRPHRNPLWQGPNPFTELIVLLTQGADALAQFSICNLEPPYSRPLRLLVIHHPCPIVLLQSLQLDSQRTQLLGELGPLGVGTRTIRVCRPRPSVRKSVQAEVLRHVPEEVLLPPALDHPPRPWQP